MFQVSAQAASHVQRIRDAKGVDPAWVTRIAATGDGLTLRFAAAPRPDDEQVSTDAFTLYLAAGTAAALADRVLDSGFLEGRPRLVLRAHRSPQPESTA